MRNYAELLENLICGRYVDFFLEDDMFEVEGRVKSDGDVILIEVLDAVMHLKEMSGGELQLIFSDSGLKAERSDTGQVFQAEINRVFHKIKNLKAAQLNGYVEQGVDTFFRKDTDTLIWFDKEKWFIELNNVNTSFGSNRIKYDSAFELCEDNASHIGGIWEAVFYSSNADVVEL